MVWLFIRICRPSWAESICTGLPVLRILLVREVLLVFAYKNSTPSTKYSTSILCKNLLSAPTTTNVWHHATSTSHPYRPYDPDGVDQRLCGYPKIRWNVREKDRIVCVVQELLCSATFFVLGRQEGRWSTQVERWLGKRFIFAFIPRESVLLVLLRLYVHLPLRNFFRELTSTRGSSPAKSVFLSTYPNLQISEQDLSFSLQVVAGYGLRVRRS